MGSCSAALKWPVIVIKCACIQPYAERTHQMVFLVSGAAFIEVPHDSESSTGGSATSGTSLREDAVLNPVKQPSSGQHGFNSCP